MSGPLGWKGQSSKALVEERDQNKGDEVLDWAAHGACRISVFWDIHKLTEQSSEQPHPISELALLWAGFGPGILQEFVSMILSAKTQAILVQETRRYSSTTSHEVSFT